MAKTIYGKQCFTTYTFAGKNKSAVKIREGNRGAITKMLLRYLPEYKDQKNSEHEIKQRAFEISPDEQFFSAIVVRSPDREFFNCYVVPGVKHLELVNED